MRNYVDFVEGTDGKAVAGAFVRVLRYPSGTDAPLFSDSSGVVPLANPVRTDNTGEFSFYIADGHYTLEITGTGLSTQTVTDVVIFDPTSVMEGSAAVVTVAGIAADVTAVAAIAADVSTVADNINALTSAAAASASAAHTSELNAAASFAAAQLIASGSLVSEQQFTGGGPWLMTAPVVAVTAIYVNGQKKRLANFSTAGSPPLVVNTSTEFIGSDALIDIQYVAA